MGECKPLNMLIKKGLLRLILYILLQSWRFGVAPKYNCFCQGDVAPTKCPISSLFPRFKDPLRNFVQSKILLMAMSVQLHVKYIVTPLIDNYGLSGFGFQRLQIPCTLASVNQFNPVSLCTLAKCGNVRSSLFV